MLSYFSSKENLTDVLRSINGDRPRIIITEYNCLLNNRSMIRDDNEEEAVSYLTELINNCKTLEFKIFDNKTSLSEIIDGLKIVNLYEPILSQEELFVEFKERYNNILKTEENVWTTEIEDYRKNNLLGRYCSEIEFENVDVILLFSTLTDAINYMLFQPIRESTKIIVFDILSSYPHIFKNMLLEFLKKEGLKKTFH